MSEREDHRKYDISISKFLNGLFTKFRGGVYALQKILLDALRNLRLPCEIDFFLDLGGGVRLLFSPLYSLHAHIWKLRNSFQDWVIKFPRLDNSS